MSKSASKYAYVPVSVWEVDGVMYSHKELVRINRPSRVSLLVARIWDSLSS